MLRFIALGIAILAVVPGVTAAQEPDIQYDRDSPAGTEYALPLAQARNQGGGSSGGADAGAGTPGSQLFGAGISKRDGAGAVPPSTAEERSGTGTGTSAQTGTSGAAPRTGRAAARSSAAGAQSEGVSGLLVALIVGLLVLLTGVGVSVVLRQSGGAATG